MSSSDKFCLKWNDFQKNISTTFYDIWQDSEFTDVTLVSEGDEQISAHKMILQNWDILAHTTCPEIFSKCLE